MPTHTVHLFEMPSDRVSASVQAITEQLCP
jgi:hypothetical protein